MALRLVQFLAIMLTALALVPSGAHLAALPNKMAMAQSAYFVAQQIYAGWALFGIVLFGALVANLAHAIVLRKLGRSFGYALASSSSIDLLGDETGCLRHRHLIRQCSEMHERERREHSC